MLADIYFKCPWETSMPLCYSNAAEPEQLCDDQVVSCRVAALPDNPGSQPSSVLPETLPPPQ